MAVTTHRITAMITYCSGDGCGRSSPGSSPGGCSTAPPSSSCATSPTCSSTRASVPAGCAASSAVPALVAVGSVMRALLPRLGHEVHDGEDDDPHDVDEVPVQAGDLDLLRIL